MVPPFVVTGVLINSPYKLEGVDSHPFLYVFRMFFVTLASPKLLALGQAKEKSLFLLLDTRFFVTLPRCGEVTPSKGEASQFPIPVGAGLGAGVVINAIDPS